MSVERVGGGGPVNNSSRINRPRSTGASGFSSLLSAGDNGDAGAVTGTAPAQGLDALLSLQQVDPDGSPNRRGRKRAEDMLRGLERLRDDVLLGHISGATLQTLQQQLDQQGQDILDPRLKEIVDDIALRVAVELAKWQRHHSNNGF